MRLPNSYGSISKLPGKRRRPYRIQVTTGWELDPDSDTLKQKRKTIGYTATKSEALNILSDYHNNPYDIDASKATFKDVYEAWSSAKYPTISRSNVHGYISAYKSCEKIYPIVFKELRLADLQDVVDSCGKNYPMLQKLKHLFGQMYSYAMKNDICGKDYAKYVDISKYKNQNPNKRDRDKFSYEEIFSLWQKRDDPNCQIVLMLIYNGCRVSEFLNLKKENVHLDEQYFDVINSKTSNGVRKVPIADIVLPFYEQWMSSSNCEYLIHDIRGCHFTYSNFYGRYYGPSMEELGISRTPHCTRHTCASLLAEARVDDTVIKKIVGHHNAMSLTESVYTHLDTETLLDGINAIHPIIEKRCSQLIENIS